MSEGILGHEVAGGGGETVALLNGGMMTWASWKPVARALGEGRLLDALGTWIGLHPPLYALMHGTLELVEKGVSVIILAGEDETRPLTDRLTAFAPRRTA